LHEHGIQVNGSFVVGFDGDTKIVSALADWIEENRMECATFHILTPYRHASFPPNGSRRPFAASQLDLYDTRMLSSAKQMSSDELLLGYDWLYEAFSHTSIWASSA